VAKIKTCSGSKIRNIQTVPSNEGNYSRKRDLSLFSVRAEADVNGCRRPRKLLVTGSALLRLQYVCYYHRRRRGECCSPACQFYRPL